MSHQTIAMIGAGNMGASLIGGLIQHGHSANRIWATDPDETKLTQLKQQFGIHTTINNIEAIQAADVVIFAVKPQIFATVATGLRDTIQVKKPLVLSIAAGIREESIQAWLGGQIAIVRSMPNTPALVGCGATALFANAQVTQAQHQLAEDIMKAVGIIVWLEDESQMNVVTALSGSGPAYFFLMMEALQDAAIEHGLSKETARMLTLQTALGAARMAIENDTPLDVLRKNVTSPGGTTERAVNVLEENDIRGVYRKAIKGAAERSVELAEQMGK